MYNRLHRITQRIRGFPKRYSNHTTTTLEHNVYDQMNNFCSFRLQSLILSWFTHVTCLLTKSPAIERCSTHFINKESRALRPYIFVLMECLVLELFRFVCFNLIGVNLISKFSLKAFIATSQIWFWYGMFFIWKKKTKINWQTVIKQ